MSHQLEIASQSLKESSFRAAAPQMPTELTLRDDDLRSAKHFDEGARTYAAAYNAHDGAGHSFRARRAKAQELLGNGPLGNLLDVGGASGVYFDALKSQVSSYHILDVSPLMIEEAHKIQSDRVPLHCHLASAYELPFPDNHFDTVIAMGVLEYLDQPWKGLEEMKRVTKPGGVILISYPNAGSPMRKMTQALYKLLSHGDPFSGSLTFTVKQVRDAAKTLQLKETGLRGYNAQLVPFPFTWRLKKISYYLAEILEPLLGAFGNEWGTSFNMKYEKETERGESV